MTSPGPSSTHRYPTRRRVTLGEDTGDLPDGPTPPVPPIDHGPEDHYDPHTVEESEADLSEEHEEEPHEPAGSGIPEEDEGGEHTPHRDPDKDHPPKEKTAAVTGSAGPHIGGAFQLKDIVELLREQVGDQLRAMERRAEVQVRDVERRALQSAYEAEARAKEHVQYLREDFKSRLDERDKAIASLKDHKPSEKRIGSSEPVKLRLEGTPIYPDPGTNAPFYLFAEDWESFMGLLGYKEIVEAAPEDTSVKASDDAIMLRYLCGALKNNTLSAHISRTYASKGREAWQYLKTEFELKRIT